MLAASRELRSVEEPSVRGYHSDHLCREAFQRGRRGMLHAMSLGSFGRHVLSGAFYSFDVCGHA